MSYLDSPSANTSTTYKVQIRRRSAGTAYVNRTSADSDAATTPRGTCTITVMEVKG